MATWEAILDYIYNKYPLEKCINNHIWRTSTDKSSKDITIHNNIRKKYLKDLN